MKLTPSQLHLGGADGIRAIACLAVIFHHFAQRLDMNAQTEAVRNVQAFLLAGNTGVSIFFVLSGFLLAFPFWKHYIEGAQYPAIRQYMFRRAARIVPAYYLVFIVSMILVVILNIPSGYFLLRSITGLTFTSAFHYITFFPSDINGPFWSISFEVFCYVLMPLFMLAMFRLLKGRSIKIGLVYWIGVVILILVMNQFIHIYLTPGPEYRGWQYGNIGGAKFWMPHYNPIGMFAHFAIGILASGVAAKLNHSYEKLEKIKRAGIFDLIGGVSLILAIVFIWFVRSEPEFSVSLQQQPFFYPYFAILIAIPLAIGTHTLLLKKVLDNALFKFIAKISFGLYLWHYLFISLVAMWETDYHYFGIASIAYWAIISGAILLVSIIISTLSYYIVEEPVIKWARKIRFNKKAITEKVETFN